MLLHLLCLLGLYVFRYAFHAVPRNRCLCGYDLQETPFDRPCAECGRRSDAWQRRPQVQIHRLPFAVALLLLTLPIVVDVVLVLVLLGRFGRSS